LSDEINGFYLGNVALVMTSIGENTNASEICALEFINLKKALLLAQNK